MVLSVGACTQIRTHNAGKESVIVLIGLLFCQRHVHEFLAYISRKYLYILYAFYFNRFHLPPEKLSL